MIEERRTFESPKASHHSPSNQTFIPYDSSMSSPSKNLSNLQQSAGISRSRSNSGSSHSSFSASVPPLALPLLQGLLLHSSSKNRLSSNDGGSDVSSSAADQKEVQRRLANDALKRFQAGRFVAKWCAERSRRRRVALGNSDASFKKKPRRKRVKESSKPAKNEEKVQVEADDRSICNSHHWLIQALQGYSHPQRQAACQLLAQVPLDDFHMWLWIDLLQYLLSSSSSSRSTSIPITTASLSWLALLQHLLEVGGPSTRLAFSVRGVPWLARQLYESTKPSSTTAAATTPTGTPSARDGTTPTRVVREWQLGVVTLLKAIVLEDGSAKDGSKVSAKIQHRLWNVAAVLEPSLSNGNSAVDDDKESSLFSTTERMTPLACLVGAYHTLRNSPATLPKGFKARPQAATLEALAALIDPNGGAGAAVSATAPTDATKNTQKGKLTGESSSSSYKTILESFRAVHKVPEVEAEKASSSAAPAPATGRRTTATTEGSSLSSRSRDLLAQSRSILNSIRARSSSNHSSGSFEEASSSSPMASSLHHQLAEQRNRLQAWNLASSSEALDLNLSDSESGEDDYVDDELIPNDEDDHADDQRVDGVQGGAQDNNDGNHGDSNNENAVEVSQEDGHHDDEHDEDEMSYDDENENDDEHEMEEGLMEEDQDDDDAEENDEENNNEEAGVEDEEDEVIDSDEGEDDEVVVEEEIIEDGADMIIDDEDIHDEEVNVADLQAARLMREEASSAAADIHEEHQPDPVPDTTISKDRKRSLLKACMQVLQHQGFILEVEQSLLECMMNIVRPPKKPLNTKLILRRAPTQEEFFRGNLSRNPISVSMLKNNKDPTVADLRQWIADDLQMSDSAELLEVLVANKILSVDLKLRVVNQVLWKTHLIESSNNGGSGSGIGYLSSRGAGGPSFFASGSGLSMIFSSGDRGLGGAGGAGINARTISEDTPVSALPPIVCTYRLTGVDGEATEDTVSTLADPEAPAENSPEEREKLIEQEYGVTRILTEGDGVVALLRATERHLSDVLRKIRRDSIDEGTNKSREKFKKAKPYTGLSLLVCCSKLPSNRKLLLESRAPTVLLRLLLNVLHALEEGNASICESESNSTAKLLQELIEVLASEISNVSTASTRLAKDSRKSKSDHEDTSTLRLLISSIQTSSLSRPLRNVIAKLLPYLTYGQLALSKELALEFDRHVAVEELVNDIGNEDVAPAGRSILMDTFVHSSMNLPTSEVCNSLRSQLVDCGFVQRIAQFLILDAPSSPPPWSPSLWSKDEEIKKQDSQNLEKQWRIYLGRPGLKTALNMLIGISKKHAATQSFLASVEAFLMALHWMEATSDNASAGIEMNGLGLVSETLLDEMSEGNVDVSKQVNAIRRKTRDRKKEIALAKRSKTLTKMGSFGKSASSKCSTSSTGSQESAPATTSAAASFLGPIVDRLFRDSSANSNKEESQAGPATKRQKIEATPTKPAWMLEMEQMEDETGLTCAVCQEGRTLQPSELLGLYAYVKKVSVPPSQCGGSSFIDGKELLMALPARLPESLAEDVMLCELWYPSAKTIGIQLKEQNRTAAFGSAANSRRTTYFTTTVSAGNGIHTSCHVKARNADRNHPKAPKSEWEGASLRNSRVNCNVILPLVSSRSSKVPLVAVDVALTEHQTAISNLLGVRPKSMLWCILHDVRFLLLRMAYGEALNADCGGGSLSSNAQLLYYQLLMADMFEKDAQIDSPQMSQHARNLSAGFLVASAVVDAEDYRRDSSSLLRALADSAPMAALTCVLFHNQNDEFGSTDGGDNDCSVPHPKRRWVFAKDKFLRGLLKCAGRRHALGIENSGCVSGRNAGTKRSRSSSFADWDMLDENETPENCEVDPSPPTRSGRRHTQQKADISDFRDALRPALVYYAIMDQVSADFVLNMDDCKVEECADRLVKVIKTCQGSRSIQELLRHANVTMEHSDIIDELQKGMISA